MDGQVVRKKGTGSIRPLHLRINRCRMRSESRVLSQDLRFVGLLPGEFRFIATEMAVRGSLFEDRPAEFEMIDDATRRHREKVLKVSKDDVLAAAKKHLRLDRVKIIAVGSGGTLSEVLSTFGHVKEIKRSSEGRIHRGRVLLRADDAVREPSYEIDLPPSVAR